VLIIVGGVLGLFLALMVCLELGRRIGRRRVAEPREGLATVEGAVFALLGLLLAFSFSAASSRFDTRRKLIVDEGNAVDTAYRRLDLLPAPAQAKLRPLFGQYLDVRFAYYRRLASLASETDVEARTVALEDEIWSEARAGCRAAGTPEAPLLVLPALNAMFDLMTARVEAVRAHLPGLIVGLLIVLELICALLAGYGMSARSWLHVVCFAAIIAVTTYIVFDYEFPRVGLIRVDRFDHVLLDLRARMP
jgi:hypothetical protein